PVWVDPRFYGRPNWFFRPAYVVQDQFLVGSLFVRMRTNHYYFGDYFDPRYERLGFQSWVDFRIGRVGYDPMFAYYRWHHRDNPRWERDLRQLYVARRAGDIPRPPHTLVQQTTIIRNARTTNVTNINQVTVLKPLKQVNNTVKLQPVSPARLAE